MLGTCTENTDHYKGTSFRSYVLLKQPCLDFAAFKFYYDKPLSIFPSWLGSRAFILLSLSDVTWRF